MKKQKVINLATWLVIAFLSALFFKYVIVNGIIFFLEKIFNV